MHWRRGGCADTKPDDNSDNAASDALRHKGKRSIAGLFRPVPPSDALAARWAMDGPSTGHA